MKIPYFLQGVKEQSLHPPSDEGGGYEGAEGERNNYPSVSHTLVSSPDKGSYRRSGKPVLPIFPIDWNCPLSDLAEACIVTVKEAYYGEFFFIRTGKKLQEVL